MAAPSVWASESPWRIAQTPARDDKQQPGLAVLLLDERGYGAFTDRVLAHSSVSSIAGASAGAGLAAASASTRHPAWGKRHRGRIADLRSAQMVRRSWRKLGPLRSLSFGLFVLTIVVGYGLEPSRRRAGTSSTARVKNNWASDTQWRILPLLLLALWRGELLADLAYEPFATGEIARVSTLSAPPVWPSRT